MEMERRVYVVSTGRKFMEGSAEMSCQKKKHKYVDSTNLWPPHFTHHFLSSPFSYLFFLQLFWILCPYPLCFYNQCPASRSSLLCQHNKKKKIAWWWWWSCCVGAWRWVGWVWDCCPWPWVGGSKGPFCQIMGVVLIHEVSHIQMKITLYSKGWEVISKALPVPTHLKIIALDWKKAPLCLPFVCANTDLCSLNKETEEEMGVMERDSCRLWEFNGQWKADFLLNDWHVKDWILGIVGHSRRIENWHGDERHVAQMLG